MMILNVTNDEGFTLSLQDTFLDKLQRGGLILQEFLPNLLETNA